MSAIGSRWESGYDESNSCPDSSYRTAQSSFRSGRSFRTPTAGLAAVVPNETLQRSIADTPELAEGVAIVRRRLDCKFFSQFFFITTPLFLNILNIITFKYYNVPFSGRYPTLHNSTHTIVSLFKSYFIIFPYMKSMFNPYPEFIKYKLHLYNNI